MPTICAAVIARDAEEDIGDCLASLDWADERLVILDTRSADRTAEIAAEMGARVVPHPFEDFAAQREFGLSLCESDWLFYVDTDERVPPPLAREIREVIEDDSYAGWWVSRRNFFWGNEIRHGGWYPDYQLRLFRIGQAHYDMSRPVHEVVILDGTEGYLREPLIHYNYRNLRQFIAKQRQYVAYEARILRDAGARARPWTYLLQPLREFRRRYCTLQGYRDGFWGLVLCALVAYYYGFRATVELGRLRRREG
ncbi:MAG: glycosyltransferase family 2 protein [Anaerolineae bacterium]